MGEMVESAGEGPVCAMGCSVREEVDCAVGRFMMDARRWVRPQSIADRDELSARRVVGLLYRHPPLRAMAWFRIGSLMNRLKVPGVPGWVQRRLVRVFGLDMVPSDDIGGGFYVAHTVGSVLVAERVGENVTVISQATFGTRDDHRWPIIDDDVFVGAGARILGGVTVGRGARIGANAVVISDVEPETTVVGIPATEVGRGRLTSTTEPTAR